MVIVSGPTATGKTALAIRMAREVGGEIVSADARQIYRGMDIGTGKDLPNKSDIKYQKPASPELQRGESKISPHPAGPRQRRWQIKNQKFEAGYYLIDGVRVWLYDVAAPDQYFSAADYREVAWPVVEGIWRRGKRPLVVGGTGFYIKALRRGLGSEGIPPDWELRRRLNNWTVAPLARRLQELSSARWGRMNESDRRNPRRLIRAIELSLKIGDEAEDDDPDTKLEAGDVLSIGLFAPYGELYRRMDRRVDAMMEAGLLGEVKRLVKHYGWSAPGLDGIGYRQFRPYFEGKSNLAECAQKVKFATHAYARRQMIWFKREPGVVWFDVSQPGFDEQALKLVKSFR